MLFKFYIKIITKIDQKWPLLKMGGKKFLLKTQGSYHIDGS